MTYLEKFRLDHPKATVTDDRVFSLFCPSMYGYEKTGSCARSKEFSCTDCWNREMKKEKS